MVPLCALILLLGVLIYVYSKIFVNLEVNHDNLLQGLLSGLMLNQQFDFEKSGKRHQLRLLGVTPLTYFGAHFVTHYVLFFLFSIYILLRIQFWNSDAYNKGVYMLSRVVIGFSLIPFVYLMGHFLKGFKKAETYTVLILYFLCWLLYNGYTVWKDRIFECLGHGFPDDLLFHLNLINPFVYVIELSTMQSTITDLNIKGIPVTLFIVAHSLFQILMGVFFFWLLLFLSRREFTNREKPERK